MIIVSPYAKLLRNGSTKHPKNYPYWKELVSMIKELDIEIYQVGGPGEEAIDGITNLHLSPSLTELEDLVKKCKTWISVDSFFQHFCWNVGKPGIVLWGQSDPKIFGHPENINLIKSRNNLREKQFWLWEQTEYKPEVFVEPKVVMKHLRELL